MSGPGLGYRFLLRIDRQELGVFTKVEGLSATYDTLTIKEGGLNGHVHKLPGRLTHENVKLTRPVDASSGRLAAWFSDFESVLEQGGHLQRVEAAVSAVDADDEVVATWTLAEVCPVRYTGPSFQAGQANVLSEVLELAHHGFRVQAAGAAAATSGPGTGAAVPAGLPSAPRLPTMPRLPSLPAMPAVPSLPAVPAVPTPPSPPTAADVASALGL